MQKNTLKQITFLLVGAFGAGIVYRLTSRGKAPQPKVRFHPSQHFAEGEWDCVDESSWESFPASDPPSHSPTIIR